MWRTKIEIDVKQGHADDALHALRLAIVEKSFIYRAKIRKGNTNPNTGYNGRTRSQGELRAVESRIIDNAKVTHFALLALRPPDSVMEIYKKLQPDDVACSTAVVDFNAAGQRNSSLSWIWHTGHAHGDDPVWMQECKSYSVCRKKSY